MDGFICSFAVYYSGVIVEIRNESIAAPKTIDVTGAPGNTVYFASGKRFGKIKGLHMDPKSLALSGMTIEGGTGVFKGNHYISRIYIAEMSETSVVLSIGSLNHFNGKKIVDTVGNSLGIIESFELTPEGVLIKGIDKEKRFSITEKQVVRLGETCIIK